MRVFPGTALFLILSAGSRATPQQSPPAPSSPPAAPDVAAGKRNFEGHCALCHGIDGGGGRGPSLRRAKLARAADDEALKSLIENGIAPEMAPAWFLAPEEIAGVAAYVRTLGKVPPEVLPGDPARGKAVYARSGCSVCHILAGEGSGYAPNSLRWARAAAPRACEKPCRIRAKPSPKIFSSSKRPLTPARRFAAFASTKTLFQFSSKTSKAAFTVFAKASCGI